MRLMLCAALVLAGCQSAPAPSTSNEPPPDGEPRAAADAGPASAGQPVSPPAPAEEAPALTEAERRLAQEVVRARIEAEKRDVVARYFLDAAREDYRRTRYDAARANLHRVLDLDPSPEVREEAEAMLVHVESGGFGTRAVFEQMVARSNVQVQQAIAEAHVLLEEGRLRMSRRDFGGAVERFERAEEVLRWLPYESRPVLVQMGGSLAEADRVVLEAERARDLREEARRGAEADR